MKRKIGRLLALFLALVMVFALVSCGDSTTEEAREDEPVAGEVEEVDEVEEVEPETDKELESEGEIEEEPEPEDTTDNSATAFVSGEMEVYNADGVTITAICENSKIPDLSDLPEEMILMSYSWGSNIYFDCVNNSESAITFSVTDASLNGYMISSGFYSSRRLEPGDSIQLYLSAPYDEWLNLSQIGIETIDTLQFEITVNNEDDDTENSTGMITWNISDGNSSAPIFDASGDVLFNDNNIFISDEGIQEYKGIGKSLMFYVENNSDRDIDIVLQADTGSGTTSQVLQTLYPQTKSMIDYYFSDLSDFFWIWGGPESGTDVTVWLQIKDTDTGESIGTTDTITVTYE